MAHQPIDLLLLALQHLDDSLGYGGPALDRNHADIIRIGHLEGVHHDPVMPRDNQGVKNLNPLGRHDPGYLVEDAWCQIIVGNHRVFARSKFLVEALLDQHLTCL